MLLASTPILWWGSVWCSQEVEKDTTPFAQVLLVVHAASICTHFFGGALYGVTLVKSLSSSLMKNPG